MGDLTKELENIRNLKMIDPEEAEERSEALKIRVKEFIEKNQIDGQWRLVLERQVGL